MIRCYFVDKKTNHSLRLNTKFAQETHDECMEVLPL